MNLSIDSINLFAKENNLSERERYAFRDFAWERPEWTAFADSVSECWQVCRFYSAISARKISNGVGIGLFWHLRLKHKRFDFTDAEIESAIQEFCGLKDREENGAAQELAVAETAESPGAGDASEEVRTESSESAQADQSPPEREESPPANSAKTRKKNK